jgi:hypothetical protein
MSQGPIMRVTYWRDKVTYSVISIWPGKFPGTYSISRDKGTEKWPAISLVEVIKAFAAGDGFINVSVESQREQRSGGGPRPRDTGGDFGGGDFGGDDVPFAPRDERL